MNRESMESINHKIHTLKRLERSKRDLWVAELYGFGSLEITYHFNFQTAGKDIQLIFSFYFWQIPWSTVQEAPWNLNLEKEKKEL